MLLHIQEYEPYKCVYKDLRLSNYYQLVLIAMPKFLYHGIRATDSPTCEAKWPYMFHITQYMLRHPNVFIKI